jgi:hypothetical protein
MDLRIVVASDHRTVTSPAPPTARRPACRTGEDAKPVYRCIINAMHARGTLPACSEEAGADVCSGGLLLTFDPTATFSYRKSD